MGAWRRSSKECADQVVRESKKALGVRAVALKLHTKLANPKTEEATAHTAEPLVKSGPSFRHIREYLAKLEKQVLQLSRHSPRQSREDISTRHRLETLVDDHRLGEHPLEAFKRR